jgi:CheY-like chemotaxis protein
MLETPSVDTPPKILIANPYLYNIDHLKLILGHLNCVFLSARTSAEYRNQFKTIGSNDLVFLDASLINPPDNPLTFSLKANSKIKIIITARNNIEEIYAKNLFFYANAVLLKPFDIPEVISHVQALLKIDTSSKSNFN